MKRTSTVLDRFDAAKGERITITVEARNTPHDTTFSGSSLDTIADPPPFEKKRLTMGTSQKTFTITYTFPPSDVRDMQAHYLITFEGKGGTSDGPTKIRPSLSSDFVALLYEFNPAAEVTLTAKKAGKKSISKRARG